MKLLELRKALGLTLAKFAERIGTTAAAISNWEHGEKIPDVRVYQICKEFNVNREWLETGVGEMFEAPACPASFEDQVVAMYLTLPEDLQAVWRAAAEKIIAAGNDPEKAARDAEAAILAAVEARLKSKRPENGKKDKETNE